MLAIEARPPTPAQLDAAQRAYFEISQPIVKAIVRIYACCQPRYLFHPDGKIELLDDGIPPALREIVAEYRKVLADLATSYGLVP